MIADAHLPGLWLAAARDPQISGELELVYAHVAREIERRGPVCWASGRCCNFEKTGHRLYVTGLEAAYTVVNLSLGNQTEPRAHARDDQPGATGVSPELALGAPPELTQGALNAARARGGCPFQSANLCSVHTIKPLGCRVYFCDKSAQEWQRSLTEAALADIRAIHEAHDITYRYGEWREMLTLFVSEPRA